MSSAQGNKIGPYLDLGLQFAIAIGLGVGVGYLADGKLKTFPLFLILGMFLGAVAGFLNIYRAVYPNKKMKSKTNDRRHEE